MKWFWVVLLLSLPSVMGVTIHGTVYDFGLDSLTDAVVEINTTPRQQMVTSQGTYLFKVPPGTYLLKARHPSSDSAITETIITKAEGDYVLDLILFPSLEAEEELLDEELKVEIIEEGLDEKPLGQWLIWLIVLIALGYLIYRVIKQPEKIVQREIVREIKAVDEDLGKILNFLDQEGGRTTQKEIRKQFAHSEAKVSLMIDELQEKGLIKKVKKGRGNLILKV